MPKPAATSDLAPGAPPRAKGAIGLALAVVVAGLAFDPAAYADEPKRVIGLCVALGASVLAVLDVRPRESRRRASGAVLAALAFFVLSAVSLAWGASPGRADVATWAAGIGAGWFALRLPRTPARWAARWAACGLGGGAAAVTLGAAALGHRGFALHGGQGNPNWLGLLLAVTLPLSLDAARMAPRRRAARRSPASTALVLAAVAVQVPALYLSHSRVAWVAAGCAWTLQVALALAARGSPARAASGAGALTLCAVLVALAVWPASGAGAMTGDEMPASQSLAGRAWIWKTTARAAAAEAPWGAGLGRFGFAFHDAQGRALATISPRSAARRYSNATTAHDDYLQAACESGLLAALALIAMFALAVRAHARARWPAGAAATMACAVAALGDSPLRHPAIVLLVGILVGASARRSERRESPAPSRRLAQVGGLAATAAFSVLLFGATRSWAATRLRTTAMDLAPGPRIARLERSVALDPASGEALLDLGMAELTEDEAARALAHFERARAMMADVSVLVGMADARMMLGRTTEAVGAYRAALAWEPGSLRARLGLGRALIVEHDLDAAERTAGEAERLAPSDVRVRGLTDAVHEARMADDSASDL